MSDYEIRDPRFNELLIGHAGSGLAVAGQTSLYSIHLIRTPPTGPPLGEALKRAARPSVGADLGAVLAPASVKDAGPVESAIGVRAEIVAQALQQVGGTSGAPEPVVIGERGRERRGWNAGGNGERNRLAPRAFPCDDGVSEMVGKQQGGKRRLALVGVHDAVEHASADDAAAAPDRRDLAKIEAPAVLRARGGHLLEALRISDDLRGV